MTTLRIILELTTERDMEDWIDKLKRDEEVKAQRAETNAKTENRHADVVAAKAPALWDEFVSQVKTQVEKLRKTFHGDPAKDVEYSVLDEGFSVVRNGFPHIRIEVLWGKVSPTAAVWVHTRSYEGADEESSRKEIGFCWAAADSVRMVFEGRSHMDGATLAEQILRKLLDHR
ncbi:MAG: hypothetical protein ABSG65_35765 [Bryobacteraceae bacterium]|jgi:hypothetical protein